MGILNISHFDSLLVRPGVSPLSQSGGSREEICRLKTLRFHVAPWPGQSGRVSQPDASQPSHPPRPSALAPGENVDPGKVP